MATNEVVKCEHPSRRCKVEIDEPYCSAACASKETQRCPAFADTWNALTLNTQSKSKLMGLNRCQTSCLEEEHDAAEFEIN